MQDSEIMQLVISGNNKEAIDKIVEYYSNDEDKKIAWIMFINDLEEKDYKSKLEIQDGWTWEKERNYTYIRGRVKNMGDKTIRYFEIAAEYMDNNSNVLDTDYTNSGESIRPGNQKEFEIMHRNDPKYSKVRIFVDEVSIE